MKRFSIIFIMFLVGTLAISCQDNVVLPESDPTSPILTLSESWSGVINSNGLKVDMLYDKANAVFSGTVENVSTQTICYIQFELNLKQGSVTVLELGPNVVGDLKPGQQGAIRLVVADNPSSTNVMYNGWEIHPEIFDCNGSGPPPNTGGGEGIGEGPEGTGSG